MSSVAKNDFQEGRRFESCPRLLLVRNKDLILFVSHKHFMFCVPVMGLVVYTGESASRTSIDNEAITKHCKPMR